MQMDQNAGKESHFDNRSRKRARAEDSRHSDRRSSHSRHSPSPSSDSSARSRNRKHSPKKRKEKKRKFSCKESKSRSSKRRKRSRHSLVIDQRKYGKYGILRESDFHQKSISFQAWLRDIKHISDFNGPKHEAMELFRGYMEDYNTATLPHKKYYDIEKYELKRFHKKQAQKNITKGINLQRTVMKDEEQLRNARQGEQIQQKEMQFQTLLGEMDPDRIQAMRSREQLRNTMQMQYKAGNVAEARRIEQLLKKEA